MMTNLPAIGARIRLVSLDDPYSRLRPGSEGTVTNTSDGTGPRHGVAVDVRWDDGSTLSLIPDAGDRWEVI